MSSKTAEASGRKAADAVFILDSMIGLPTPVVINATEVSERTGVKVNTIMKRFSVFRQRYPGLNLQTTTRSSNSGAGSSASQIPATPVTKVVRKKTPASIKSSTKTGSNSKQRSNSSSQIMPDQDSQDADASALDKSVKEEDELANLTSGLTTIKSATATSNKKRKHASASPTATKANGRKKAKTTMPTNETLTSSESADELASEDEWISDIDGHRLQVSNINPDGSKRTAQEAVVSVADSDGLQNAFGIGHRMSAGFLSEEGTTHQSSHSSLSVDMSAMEDCNGRVSIPDLPADRSRQKFELPTSTNVYPTAPELSSLSNLIRPSYNWSLLPPPPKRDTNQPQQYNDPLESRPSLTLESLEPHHVETNPPSFTSQTSDTSNPQSHPTSTHVPAISVPETKHFTFFGTPLNTSPLSTCTLREIEKQGDDFVGGLSGILVDGSEDGEVDGTSTTQPGSVRKYEVLEHK